jgi:Tol biopolymer transport system component
VFGCGASKGVVVVVGKISISGWRAVAAAAVATLVVGTAVTAAAPTAGAGSGAVATTRVPVDRSGQQANGRSSRAAVSADGRFVAFESLASNLVPGDTNHRRDVFVRDRVAQVTRRVSVGPGGQQANGGSLGVPAISADGRFVAFASFASNLVPGDTNVSTDVFVRDRVAQVTRRVSVGPGGQQSDSFGGDPAISAHGRFVAFISNASNLVAGDTNDAADLFVRDRVAQVTRRVSVGPGGQQANDGSLDPSISARGRFVAFASLASNLVPGDTNRLEVFVRDRKLQVTRRVSVGPGGQQANGLSFEPTISADGRFVAFQSIASNLVAGDTNNNFDVFVRDRVAQLTRRVSVGPGGQQASGGSAEPAISAHGRFVAFRSNASNLVAGDTNGVDDVFVRDRGGQLTARVSVGPGGQQANRVSYLPAISAHGRFVAFQSAATNLVAGDTNDSLDVFVRDRMAQLTQRVSVG